MMENRPSFSPADGFSNRNPPERLPSPLDSQDPTQELHISQNENPISIKVEVKEEVEEIYVMGDVQCEEVEIPPEFNTGPGDTRGTQRNVKAETVEAISVRIKEEEVPMEISIDTEDIGVDQIDIKAEDEELHIEIKEEEIPEDISTGAALMTQKRGLLTPKQVIPPLEACSTSVKLKPVFALVQPSGDKHQGPSQESTAQEDISSSAKFSEMTREERRGLLTPKQVIPPLEVCSTSVKLKPVFALVQPSGDNHQGPSQESTAQEDISSSAKISEMTREERDTHQGPSQESAAQGDISSSAKISEMTREERRALLLEEIWAMYPKPEDDPAFPHYPTKIRKQTTKREVKKEKPKTRKIGNTSWCLCGNCIPMGTGEESVCCHEIPNVKKQIPEKGECITEAEVFQSMVANKINVTIALKMRHLCSLKPPDASCNRNLRNTAYRAFVAWVYGYLKKERSKPVPACVVGAVRKTFPDPDTGIHCELDYKAADMALW